MKIGTKKKWKYTYLQIKMSNKGKQSICICMEKVIGALLLLLCRQSDNTIYSNKMEWPNVYFIIPLHEQLVATLCLPPEKLSHSYASNVCLYDHIFCIKCIESILGKYLHCTISNGKKSILYTE